MTTPQQLAEQVREALYAMTQLEALRMAFRCAEFGSGAALMEQIQSIESKVIEAKKSIERLCQPSIVIVDLDDENILWKNLEDKLGCTFGWEETAVQVVLELKAALAALKGK